MLALLGETGVEFSIFIEPLFGADQVASAEVADAGFKQVFFYRPSHKVAGDASLGHFFVECATEDCQLSIPRRTSRMQLIIRT